MLNVGDTYVADDEGEGKRDTTATSGRAAPARRRRVRSIVDVSHAEGFSTLLGAGRAPERSRKGAPVCSVGVEGVRIRDGVLAEPIREGTLAGAIPRMLLDIAEVGSDLEMQPGGSLVPSLVLGGLTLGGGG